MKKNKLKLSFDKMISMLDTACGMLMVAAMDDNEVYEAKGLVTEVSISLGEWGQDVEQDGGAE